jgi:hypothetical protein
MTLSKARTCATVVLLGLPLCAWCAPDWVEALVKDSELGQVSPADRMLQNDATISYDPHAAETRVNHQIAVLVGSDALHGDFEYVTACEGKRNLDWTGAWVVPPSGAIAKSPKSILKWNSQFGGFILYSNYLNATWTWNNVETGSIIALEFSVTYPDTVDLWRASVQSSRFAIRHSTVTVVAPGDATVRLQPVNCGAGVVSATPTCVEVGELKRWEPHPFDGGFEASVARVDVYFTPAGLVRSWTNVATSTLALWKGVERDLAPDLLHEVFPRLTSGLPLDSLRYDYERAFRYVAVEIGRGTVVPHDVADVARNRYGDCKDLALLLAEVWRRPDVVTCPVLVNAPRSRPFDPSFPSTYQFDHVILGMIVNGDTIYYDATGKGKRIGYLPAFDQGCPALWISDKSDLVTLPVDPDPLAITREFCGALLPNGCLTGSLRISWDARLDRRESLTMSKANLYHSLGDDFRPELRLNIDSTEFAADGSVLTARLTIGGYVAETTSAALWQNCPYRMELPDSVSSLLTSGYFVQSPIHRIDRMVIGIPNKNKSPADLDTTVSNEVGTVSSQFTTDGDSIRAEWSFDLPNSYYSLDQKPQLDSLLHAATELYQRVALVR